MAKGKRHKSLVLETIPENLLREPIEYIFADHYRLRQIVASLDGFLAADNFAADIDEEVRADLRVILAYLEDELPLHIADEDEGLFKFLGERCRGDDETKQILLVLTDEHEEDFGLMPPVTAGLKSLAAGEAVKEPQKFIDAAARFVETQRRHLIWENNIVLPLARRHLTPEDLENMGRQMAARRGLDYPA
ncbi:MAG: hemerythrin domain-containing protein [Alphaproteobacteria bacterium]|jgi:hemerythrin-like domain-containing protein|nr:hemerythrin domain-containing protein [Alphaproteobacteria bacterium]MDP6565238.1 hemerythrin domain-containing protein [Alphaproteobacteria bacterium]MDP6813614.1 hemerythrin domain-containing protein [Alphaproteobacteria bacterium]